VKFGLSLSGVSPRHYPTLAAAAEELGFESVWIPDHLVFPEPMPDSYLYSDDGKAPISAATAVYDPWVLLGAMSSVTTTIRFGTSVYVLPLRDPIVTARAVLTVDRISRGRVTLGAGVGWLKEEFRLVGLDPSTRGKRADEIIGLLRRLWTEDVVEHHGAYYDLPPVRFEPKPFQRPIPIEIGGSSPRALWRAGTLGDGWIEIGSSGEDQLAARVRTVLAARAQAGRDHLPFTVTAGIGLADGAGQVDRMAEIGVHRLVLRMPESLDRHRMGETLKRFVAHLPARVWS
jgi:probable F420-dependent oxidoreductase